MPGDDDDGDDDGDDDDDDDDGDFDYDAGDDDDNDDALLTWGSMPGDDDCFYDDEEMRMSLEGILNIKLHEDAWSQSSLPVKKGGLGIRMATDLALPAFLSSANGAKETVSTLLPDYIDADSYQERDKAKEAWVQLLGENQQDDQQLVTDEQADGQH